MSPAALERFIDRGCRREAVMTPDRRGVSVSLAGAVPPPVLALVPCCRPLSPWCCAAAR
eukprot:CAMPEP_0194318562 /NCGR_PEP_ID=MMETSP0171-20130528/15150_1 /TAXON_ID=218684 /ORGANISM="Corethron pennatum, Strain L29A3" /LENGTH=58 /DNA_ID=CAMNT_0039075503 /DNA_START=38 /DNA_END=211 /DNA_ORIENTATION=+